MGQMIGLRKYRTINKFSAFLLSAIVLGGFFASTNPAAAQSTNTNKQNVISALARTERGIKVLRQGQNGELVCDEPSNNYERGLGKNNNFQRMSILNASAGLRSSSQAQAQGLTIILRGTPQLNNFPEARNAFVRAANRWQAFIKTPVTVVIDVDFGPTRFGEPYPTDVLGATDAQEVGGSGLYPIVRQALIDNANTTEKKLLYKLLPSNELPTDVGSTAGASSGTALLRAQGLLPAVADPDNEPAAFGPPPSIGFNSAFTYDFNPDNGIDPGKLDFDAVATHEIGHALGFLSWNGINDIAPDAPVLPSVWDFFRYNQGLPIFALPFAPRNQRAGVEAEFVTLRGANPLSNGGPFGDRGDGFQSSHWKQGILYKKYVGIMDPALPPGFRYSITVDDLNALDAFGYQINNDARRKLPVILALKARASGDTLQATGIASGSGNFRSAFVKLYDGATGRRLAILPLSAVFRGGQISVFSFQINNFSRYPTATQISAQIVDADANFSPSAVVEIDRDNN